jgi:RNase adaptor protein for sRNA GlmZ degradation
MENKQEDHVNNFHKKKKKKGIKKDRKMLVFVEATGNGILGHVPRTRRAWPLSSKPDGILESW